MEESIRVFADSDPASDEDRSKEIKGDQLRDYQFGIMRRRHNVPTNPNQANHSAHNPHWRFTTTGSGSDHYITPDETNPPRRTHEWQEPLSARGQLIRRYGGKVAQPALVIELAADVTVEVTQVPDAHGAVVIPDGHGQRVAAR